jgi:hypothetical protein
LATTRFARGLFAQQHVTVLPASYFARDTGGRSGRGRADFARRVSATAEARAGSSSSWLA